MRVDKNIATYASRVARTNARLMDKVVRRWLDDYGLPNTPEELRAAGYQISRDVATFGTGATHDHTCLQLWKIGPDEKLTLIDQKFIVTSYSNNGVKMVFKFKVQDNIKDHKEES